MPAHLFNLLARAFSAIPTTLGSNWLGLVFTVLIVIIGEIIGGYLFGWRSVITNWKKVTGIGFAALGVGYTLIFAWCVMKTIFADHEDLNARIKLLRIQTNGSEAHESAAVKSVRDDLSGKLSDLKQTCAKTEGANGVLAKQAADQQMLIAGCQEDAIKRLAPDPLKISVFLWSDVVSNGVDHKATYLVITNKTVTPVNLLMNCDVTITSGSGSILGNSLTSGGSEVQQKNNLLINIETPAWPAQAPIRVDFDYVSSRAAKCYFYEK